MNHEHMTVATWLTESIGNTAAVCTTVSFLPQLIRVWRRKSAEDISLVMFLLFSTGVALWLVYGLLIGSFPIAAANTVTLALALAILILKLIYDRRNRRRRDLDRRGLDRRDLDRRKSGTIEP